MSFTTAEMQKPKFGMDHVHGVISLSYRRRLSRRKSVCASSVVLVRIVTGEGGIKIQR